MAIKKLKNRRVLVDGQARGDVIQYTEVELSSADVMAMNGAPVAVLDAPGANKLYEIVSCVLMHNAGSTAFASGGNITVNYAGGAAVTGTGAATMLTTS